MKRLKKYIINNFSYIFLSLFIPLFAIASVIFLIKLATYTAVIQLSIWEMTKLYIFILPELLFYILPVTFFISASLSLFKLSNDNEAVVIFSLGISPNLILRTLLKPAILLTILLAFDFMVLFPHSKVLSSNFVAYKKIQAKFNLSASEFGHSFGDWLLYLGKDNHDGSYGEVLLFNKRQKDEVLISAKKARVLNDGGILRLKLTDGEGYTYSKKSFSQIDFKTMFINNTINTSLEKYRTPIGYWMAKDRHKHKKQMFITDTLLSLFPILSLFLIISIGIVHARQQKGKIYLYLFLGILAYYISTLGLQKILSYYTIPIVAIIWSITTYMIYKKTIIDRF